MKKYFFIGNRQSGKTTKAIYEFMKDPENTIFVCPDGTSRKELLKRMDMPMSTKNVITAGHAPLKGKNMKRVIFDEYLLYDYDTRYDMHLSFIPLGIEEILCFTSPSKLYESHLFDFVVNIKKEQRILAFDEPSICFQDNLVEITSVEIRTSEKMKLEIMDLYHNYITDPDTVIIHNKLFFNQKLYNLENVSFFPDDFRELTELKGRFINDTDTKGFAEIC